MSDFEKQKFEIEELILLLEPYSDGELSFLLNAKENVDIVHDKLIAFDMEDASKKGILSASGHHYPSDDCR